MIAKRLREPPLWGGGRMPAPLPLREALVVETPGPNLWRSLFPSLCVGWTATTVSVVEGTGGWASLGNIVEGRAPNRY